MMERDSLAAVLKKETVHCFDVIVMVCVELESSMFPSNPSCSGIWLSAKHESHILSCYEAL